MRKFWRIEIKVVLDTNCVLPLFLRDLLIELALNGAFTPIWSEEIFGELTRNSERVGMPTERAEQLVSVLRELFPDQVFDLGGKALEGSVFPDPGDEHVVALALVGGAQLIVTFNLKDFMGLEALGISVVSPDELLLRVTAEMPNRVKFGLSQLLKRYSAPQISQEQYAEYFSRVGCPMFSAWMKGQPI